MLSKTLTQLTSNKFYKKAQDYNFNIDGFIDKTLERDKIENLLNIDVGTNFLSELMGLDYGELLIYLRLQLSSDMLLIYFQNFIKINGFYGIYDISYKQIKNNIEFAITPVATEVKNEI